MKTTPAIKKPGAAQLGGGSVVMSAAIRALQSLAAANEAPAKPLVLANEPTGKGARES